MTGASDIRSDPRGSQWPEWVLEFCAQQTEERRVPCVSLEHVIGDWLGGRAVRHLKLGVKGADLAVVKSAGPHVDKVLSVRLEVRCDSMAPLYRGQPNCSTVHKEMLLMGFTSEFNAERCRTCREVDIPYWRPEHFKRGSHAWEMAARLPVEHYEDKAPSPAASAQPSGRRRVQGSGS